MKAKEVMEKYDITRETLCNWVNSLSQHLLQIEKLLQFKMVVTEPHTIVGKYG